MTNTPLIEASLISASYGRGKGAVKTLSNLTFTVNEGERLCVIGPNGCGKTTLLRVLSGALPYEGSLRMRGKERKAIDSRQAARQTCFLSQLSSVYFPYTVLEAVTLGRYAREKRALFQEIGLEGKERVRQAMKDCGIEAIADVRLDNLSGGQLQRVFLARALAQDSDILLLDEPTNHLDLRYQSELVELIVGTGKTCVGVFHDLLYALRFADTLLLLDNGKIAAHGSTERVLFGREINGVYGIPVADTMRALFENWYRTEKSGILKS